VQRAKSKVQRANFKEQRAKNREQRTKFKEQSVRANISGMNKKRGGSLFFMPYLYSPLYNLYSNSD
jgi:DNA integrity scanning protein DisA with diadenylate cyclase activity